VRWVTIGAESLLEQQAAIIERAFGRVPIQHYGMAEGVANISERPDGVMVVDEDFAAVEFVRMSSGEWKILGTNLSNPAFPLIRYEVGDLADLIPGETAPEGGAFAGCRVIRNIDGRREDYVILANGAKVGRLDHIFKDLTEIREAQIVQERVGAITIKLVPGDKFDGAVEKRLKAEITDRLGEDIIMDMQYVDELARTNRGKLRFVINSLTQGRIDLNG
jgi:phenylacetate-CoA ligase